MVPGVPPVLKKRQVVHGLGFVHCLRAIRDGGEWQEDNYRSFIGNSLRNSNRGLFISEYCFGLRFFTRGSTRPGRDGLTTNTETSSPSVPISHRTASIKLIRSGATACTRAESTITDRTAL